MLTSAPAESSLDVAQLAEFLPLLRCPVSRERLDLQGHSLVAKTSGYVYKLSSNGIPLFADRFRSEEGRAQQKHYDAVSSSYIKNLDYPHTEQYQKYLDEALLGLLDNTEAGATAEICCGTGCGLDLFRHKIKLGVGVDISLAMIDEAKRRNRLSKVLFVQGDATMLPLADASFDCVLTLGGIHHVSNRSQMFREIFRILKTGGKFYFREPVNDFIPWRILRAIIYRYSPALDHETEHPLRRTETMTELDAAGLKCTAWFTKGFLGFCLFMNSDILLFNRLFRYIPAIRGITRLGTTIDDWIVRLPWLQNVGLQVIGSAVKL